MHNTSFPFPPFSSEWCKRPPETASPLPTHGRPIKLTHREASISLRLLHSLFCCASTLLSYLILSRSIALISAAYTTHRVILHLAPVFVHTTYWAPCCGLHWCVEGSFGVFRLSRLCDKGQCAHSVPRLGIVSIFITLCHFCLAPLSFPLRFQLSYLIWSYRDPSHSFLLHLRLTALLLLLLCPTALIVLCPSLHLW